MLMVGEGRCGTRDEPLLSALEGCTFSTTREGAFARGRIIGESRIVAKLLRELSPKDASVPGQRQRRLGLADLVLDFPVSAGGSLSGISLHAEQGREALHYR